ncbi:unnamed protein product [uncultured bacterium]|nr:unnamed protein product [uncultured bacterium]
MPLAPIVLFVYNRPWHTAKTLEALSHNDLSNESELHIFADGPKPGASAATLASVAEVRRVIRSRTWCKDVHITESPDNKGLAASIIDGVTSVVNRYGKVIVLEDDIVTGRSFLAFMNQALRVYEHDAALMSVTGYMYPVAESPADDVFFLRGGISCWGWGTWARAWKHFQPDARALMDEVATTTRQRFDWNGAFPYFDMLEGYLAGRNDSWGVRWYASMYLQKGLGLFPGKSLVRNIGFDGTGVHCGIADGYRDAPIFDGVLDVPRLPLVHHEKMFDQIVKLNRPAPARRFTIANLKQKLRSWLAPPPPNALPSYNCERGPGAVFHSTAVVHNAGAASKIHVGSFSHVSGILQVFADCGTIRIGDYSFLGDNSRIICAADVTIGDRVQIAHNCSIMDTDVHSLNPQLRHQEFVGNVTVGQRDVTNIPKQPVLIEDDVWIAGHCVILKGVRIGRGSVIGAGSVVTGDIPANVLAYGNPARVVRSL